MNRERIHISPSTRADPLERSICYKRANEDLNPSNDDLRRGFLSLTVSLCLCLRTRQYRIHLPDRNGGMAVKRATRRSRNKRSFVRSSIHDPVVYFPLNLEQRAFHKRPILPQHDTGHYSEA